MKKNHPWIVLARVLSSDGSRHYEIRLGHDDRVYCTCLGWKWHGHCHHLDDFRYNLRTAA